MSEPKPTQGENYEIALEFSQKILRGWDRQKLAAQADRCDVKFDPDEGDGAFYLDFFYRPCKVVLPEATPVWTDDGRSMAIWEAILVVHYLIHEEPIPEYNRLIAFKEIPEGTFYNSTYESRTRQELIRHFGENPDSLLEAAIKIGGRAGDHGDVSAIVRAFKNVPLTVIMWRGDEDFPPEGSVLFQNDVVGYLPVEDIVVVGGYAASKIAQVARELYA